MWCAAISSSTHATSTGSSHCSAMTATVMDEGETFQGLGEIRAWRTGPAIKYTYTTEVLDQEGRSGGRYLVTARLTGDFPGETVDLRCDFAVTSDLISRLVIAP